MPLYIQLQKEKSMNQNNQQSKVKQILNATIVTGQYIDKKTGETKNSYITIGTLFIYQDNGMALKLDAMPTNGQNIVFYKPKPKGQSNQNNQNYNNGGSGQPHYNQK